MATDLERLIVSIEANTKQFERAMRSLERTTDQAMRGVEGSIRTSTVRQEALFVEFGTRVGQRFGQAFRRGLGAFIGLGIIKDALKVAADANDLEAQHALDVWDESLRQAKIKSVKAGEDIAAGLNKAADALGNIKIIGDPEVTDIQKRIDKYHELTDGISETVMEVEKLSSKSQERLLPDADPSVAASSLKSFTDNLTTYVNKISSLRGAMREDLAMPTGIPTPQGPQVEVYNRLQQELILLGKTNEEQAIYNNLKAAGVAADSQWGASITALTQKLEEQKSLLASIRELNDGLEESAKTFAQGLLEGQSAADSLNAALRSLANTLLDMALKSLFNPGGTPLLQTLFSGIGGSLGTGGSLGGRSGPFSPSTVINVQGSVDHKTLAAMSGMIQRNNARQNAELQRNWGNMQSRYASLRGP
jgi:hypothetical protein